MDTIEAKEIYFQGDLENDDDYKREFEIKYE